MGLTPKSAQKSERGQYFETWPLSEDFRRSSKIVPKARRTFPNIFRKIPKIPEDVRRLPRTFEGDPKMFRWYTNEFKYNLRDKRDITEIIDIFTCEDISSHVRISYRFYQFVTTRYTTDFYIIKSNKTWSNIRIRNLKTKQSPVKLDLRLRNSRAAKLYDYRIVAFHFQNVLRPY